MTSIYRSDAGQRRVEEGYRAWLARWPVPAEFVTVPTRQGDTFVVVSGPEDAPPLVLLHGSTANSITWIGDIATYAAHFRCYCVDMIGEPGLSAPSRPDMEPETYVLWLDDVLDGLGLGRVSLVGLSLGGWMAFHYAARRAERIVALAGIAPAGVGGQKNFIVSHLPYFFLGAWGKKRIIEAIMGPGPENPPPEIVAFQDYFSLVTAEFRPRIVTLPVLTDAQIKALYFPVFVVLGGRDVMLKTGETRDRLTALAPDAVVDFRPEGRHYIPETAPLIARFLGRTNGLAA